MKPASLSRSDTLTCAKFLAEAARLYDEMADGNTRMMNRARLLRKMARKAHQVAEAMSQEKI